eukprot:TRINITY_DN6258_c0_g1_i1.p1 TRINITY_DN6258_c0_g1~~TRINITY_DN6258_c0_g1_i1.p1  ORF type:complete len:192 (-),score=58.17 TRINITY_DN6258_c0_g1_i1:92-667(-)
MLPTLNMFRLLVGLGNYGGVYNLTRHNCGLHFIDFLAKKLNVALVPEKELEGDYAKVTLKDGQHFGLYKSYTRINECGIPLKKAIDFLKIEPKQILVIHDDLERSIGKYKIIDGKQSIRGHNGLKSINKELGVKNEVWRLGIGIGRPFTRDKEAVGAYVMQSFSEEEFRELLDAYEEIFEEFVKPYAVDSV